MEMQNDGQESSGERRHGGMNASLHRYERFSM